MNMYRQSIHGIIPFPVPREMVVLLVGLLVHKNREKASILECDYDRKERDVATKF